MMEFLTNNLWLGTVAIFAAVAFFSINKRKRHEVVAREYLQKAVSTDLNEPFSLHPEIDPAKCAGCGACTRACPEGDILKLIHNKAVMVSPSKCVGHGECERACPFGAIDLVFGTKTRGVDIPRLTGDYETNVPGLYIAGELGGMGLIRNAIKQGFLAAQHACKNLRSPQPATTNSADLLIVGAGAAGLAACLTAIVQKRSYICIEQNSIGGTIYNFPRQKLVMTHPAELPGIGVMKFAKNKVSKEELLDYWSQVRRKAGVKILEKVKFENLAGQNGAFRVTTDKEVFSAQKVILAMGVRGSPRRLGLAGEDSSRVAYNLIDPEQYMRMTIAVVGGGNAAVEAAQMLAQPKYQNRVTLLVRGPTFDRCNEENKNIIETMAKKGLLRLWFDSEVKEIKTQSLTVQKKGEKSDLANQFLFVFTGAEMPHKFLMSLGIKIDKAFGDRKLTNSSINNSTD